MLLVVLTLLLSCVATATILRTPLLRTVVRRVRDGEGIPWGQAHTLAWRVTPLRTRRREPAAHTREALQAQWRRASFFAQVESGMALLRKPSFPVAHRVLQRQSAPTLGGTITEWARSIARRVYAFAHPDVAAAVARHPHPVVGVHPALLRHIGGRDPWAALAACRGRGWRMLLDDTLPLSAVVLLDLRGGHRVFHVHLADLSEIEARRIRLGEWTLDAYARASVPYRAMQPRVNALTS